MDSDTFTERLHGLYKAHHEYRSTFPDPNDFIAYWSEQVVQQSGGKWDHDKAEKMVGTVMLTRVRARKVNEVHSTYYAN